MSGKRNSIILLSGGLDSTTVLAIAQEQGFQCHTLTFNYGQRHDVEVGRARSIAEAYGVEQHIEASLDLRLFGGSALTDDIDVPKEAGSEEGGEAIPVTYVPARNTIFLSLALGWSEVVEAEDVFIGVNAVDYSGYPDCRPQFIEAYENMANLATKAGVEGRQDLTIHTPLIDLTKAEIIEKGLDLGVDYAQTITCYDPSDEGLACGRCEACHLRLKGFAEAGSKDPAAYQYRPEVLE